MTSATIPPRSSHERRVDRRADRPVDVVRATPAGAAPSAPGPRPRSCRTSVRSMIPARSRTARCSSATTRSNHGGRVQPYAAWSRPARRHGRPGSCRSARSQPAFVPKTAPRLLEAAVERREPARPAGDVGVVRVAEPVVVASTSRAPARPRTSGRGTCRANRHARYGPTSTPGSPAVIQPAIARPIPPPPPKPLSDRPAATQKPRTPGIGPSSGFASGVIASGMADEADRLGVGEEREAPDRAGHQRREALVVGRQRARGVLPRHAVLPARHGVELVPAEDHAALLALAVDEVVRVAEAGHVARQLVTRARP